MTELTDSDRELWLSLHNGIIENGRVPAMDEAAARVGGDRAAFDAALDRLHENHYVVLRDDVRDGAREFLMVHPFSPVPTPHRVTCGEKSWWANCFWDALGIPPMLGQDGRVESSCGCCGTAATFDITNGELAGGDGVVHFAVPAKHWWDDVAFT